MNIPLLENRMRSLEEMMADLIAVSAQTSIEMEKFKDRVDRSIERMDRDSIERKLEQIRFNKELGAIAHKQGRMTEDLVAPSICRILREALGLPESCGCNQAERIIRYNSKNR